MAYGELAGGMAHGEGVNSQDALPLGAGLQNVNMLTCSHN